MENTCENCVFAVKGECLNDDSINYLAPVSDFDKCDAFVPEDTKTGSLFDHE